MGFRNTMQTIRNNRMMKKNPLHRFTLLDKNIDFQVKEAYKTARTNIMFSLSGVEGCRKVIVSSANPSEGKTTTCMNLAISFAQTGAKVLLIDADLRKPRIHRTIKSDRHNGLSDLLCGFIDVEQAIRKNTLGGIDCITAGQIPPNPSELLSSDLLEKTLEKLTPYYDYIFLDSPPINMVSETTAMSKIVDGVILVVRQGYTIFESVQQALANISFADAKVLGVILNDTSTPRSTYYRYRYRYSTNYEYMDSIDDPDSESFSEPQKKKKK